MSTISERLNALKAEIPPHVTLVAVSKTHAVDRIQEAYDAGQRDFGENRVQELESKVHALPEDIRWHLIGHLQRNKVKFIAPYVHMIHSVDSWALLQEIDKQAAKCNRNIACLLQVHIAQEETKFGLSEEELFGILNKLKSSPLHHITLRGLMGMATLSDDSAQVRNEFAGLKKLFERIRAKYQIEIPQFNQLSMGMSSDWTIAVAEGSTMVRVGSSLFGSR